MSISVADPGFEIRGGGVNFVNGGGWVGVFGGIIKCIDFGSVSVFHVFDPFSNKIMF